MAELLLARTAPTERPLVLKWIRPEQAIDGTFIDAFVSEGRRAAQLHHPNIVEVHEVGREDGTHYLAMEYVHGDDLRRLLARLHERRAKLPVQHILAITTALAQALEHAHGQVDDDGAPVLHLGIKPGNVIITADGAVKLTDFGIGRAALTEGRTDLLPSIVGYLSPEQCTGQNVDRRSDVFGLGILMYELSVGRRLFKGDNEFITMSAIVAGDIPAPSKHRGDLPKELEAVILKALARAPEDRFQSAQELHSALDKFATKAGVRGSLTTLAGYTKRLFGVRPEPWLVDEDSELSGSADFDGSPKGLATPPVEALQSFSLPSFVTASDDSPIMRVKRQISRDLPTEQLNLANMKPTPDKLKIPAAANGNGARPASPKPLQNRPTPVPFPAARNKPKTVQIPAQSADKLVKEESAKVQAQAQTVEISELEEDTKESVQAPALVDALTPTKPIDPDERAKVLRKAKEEDTVPTAPSIEASKPNGVNGKPALVSLEGLKEVDQKREAANKLKRAAEDAARLPRPVVAGEIKSPSERTDTEVDELKIESTAVANPPPMPAVARDATELVKPLASPDAKSITTTDNIIVGSSRKKWLVLGGLAAVAIAAIVIGFTGGSDDEPSPSASEQVAATDEKVAVDEPKAETPPPEAKTEEQLRTSDVPRTPRNSHVTTDDQPKVDEPKPETKVDEPKPETKVDEPKPETKVDEPKPEAKVEVAAVPPPPPAPVPEAKKPKVEEPAPPKFVEPKDPSPPDEPVVVKPTKPKSTKSTKPEKPEKPKPAAVVQKPKPKPTPVAAKPKPTPVAAKPKPTPPAKPKPTPPEKPGKWDPNALFPKK